MEPTSLISASSELSSAFSNEISLVSEVKPVAITMDNSSFHQSVHTASTLIKTPNDAENEKVSSWNTIFSKPTSVVCRKHALPASLQTVNKKGPNRGRQFYVCSLTPPEKCDFFKWLSDAIKSNKKLKT
jgi:AP endonuclease-2